jgi:hypothetical protein
MFSFHTVPLHFGLFFSSRSIMITCVAVARVSFAAVVAVDGNGPGLLRPQYEPGAPHTFGRLTLLLQ